MRLQRMRVDHGSGGVRCVVESVHEFKAECNQQCDPQQYIWPRGGVVRGSKVRSKFEPGIDDAGSNRTAKDDRGNPAWAAAELLVHHARAERRNLRCKSG